MSNPYTETKRLKAVIAKYRKQEYPGEWFLTDFTMEQVERRLERASAALAAYKLVDAEGAEVCGDLEAERDEYQSDWLSASKTVIDYELEIDRLREALKKIDRCISNNRLQTPGARLFVCMLQDFARDALAGGGHDVVCL